MTDNTPTYLALLREIDRVAIERERKKLEAMTEEERQLYLEQKWLNAMVNMP